MQIVFETPRLILGQFTEADAPLILQLNSDPEIVKYVHEPVLLTEAQAKKIIIGDRASRLKEIGTRARHDIEKLLGTRVFLELFVKVEAGWRDKEHLLDELGIGGKAR